MTAQLKIKENEAILLRTYYEYEERVARDTARNSLASKS